MSSNYPAGVTGNEPEIAGERTIMKFVTCGEEEPQVVPSWAVKEELLALQLEVAQILSSKTSEALAKVDDLRQSITNKLDRMYELEDVGSYDCPFAGSLEVTVVSREQGTWDCPDCGSVHDNEDITPDDSDRFDR